MSHPSISRECLISIILADNPWCPFGGSRVSAGGDPEIWNHLHGVLAEIQADRLLDPSWSGVLLDRITVRQRMVDVGMFFGAFLIPQIPFRVTRKIAERIVDVQLQLSPIDLVRTHAQVWDRIRAICTLAQIYAMKPEAFLRTFPGAHDHVLRCSTSPDEFRLHQMKRINAVHPDTVEIYVRSLRRSLNKEARRQLKHSDIQIEPSVQYKTGDAFWRQRAQHIHAIELQIQRIWYDQEVSDEATYAYDA